MPVMLSAFFRGTFLAPATVGVLVCRTSRRLCSMNESVSEALP